METGLQKYILLNDRVGEHVDKGWHSKKTIPTQLHQGEILECLPESKQPKDPKKIALRLKFFSDLNIKLECPKLGVSALTDSEADLLLAVSSLEERFRVYRDERNLLQQSNLDVSYKVFVQKGTTKLPGIIWYKGHLPVHNGTMFGVELVGKESEGQGTCDGTFGNRKYFDCPADRGVFVSVDALRLRQEQKRFRKGKKTILSTLKDIKPSFSSKDTSAARNMAKGHKLKIDQKTVTYPEFKMSLPGPVRYISERVDSHGGCPVGIERDRRKGKEPAVFKRFVCREGNALFVPVTSVIPEEDFDGLRTENSQETSSSETVGLRSSIGNTEEYSGQKSYGKSAELAKTLDEERKIREDAERRLHGIEQRSHELELSLATERRGKVETEKSLATERQAHEETKRCLRSNEQRSHDLETSLATERQAHEETKRRLRSLEQMSHEFETSLATERQAHEETVRCLRINQQRLEELETSLVEETQAHQETENHLQSSEERSQELETTLTTLRQTYEAYRTSRESTRDWVLRRDEVRLSDKVIGIGAWGEVREGTFRGCKVAVKKIHQLILSDHNRRLFEREMNMASRCRHPCLLQFIGATNDDESPLFVTELLDTSLRAVLHERPLEPPEITTIAQDVVKGLNYLHLSHPAPVIHRDISSANVLLWKHVSIWRAKVSDYGTANFLQQSMTVNPGAVIYSAPEAQTSKQSPKLDAYSFGVLLCEMNVREMPDVDHRNEQVAMVTNSFFRNLIRRCLQQNPEERPSMAEIIEALENSPQ